MLLNITSTGDELLKIVNIDDLDWLLTLKIGFFLVILGDFGLEKSELRRNG